VLGSGSLALPLWIPLYGLLGYVSVWSPCIHTHLYKINCAFALQGIEWTAIEYFNNAIICDLIEKVGASSPRSQRIVCQRMKFRQVFSAFLSALLSNIQLSKCRITRN